MLAATLLLKTAPADETAAVNSTQSKPMAGMMEMMSPQPGSRFYGWIENGIPATSPPRSTTKTSVASSTIAQMNRS
ncbi:MAG: hypothetical protein DME60_02335 [Verrucomicrobia bacterium]|nr:MAG: hypothetical protein DME60_02335 [Verrucomicrobiota bacterium]